jgi:hypothetical protein
MIIIPARRARIVCLRPVKNHARMSSKPRAYRIILAQRINNTNGNPFRPSFNLYF